MSLENVGGISHVQTRGLRRSVGLQLEQVLMAPLRPCDTRMVCLAVLVPSSKMESQVAFCQNDEEF